MFNPENQKNSLLWKLFQKISSIPRCSGNETEIRDFLMQQGRATGCEAVADDAGNVILKREASPGLEHFPPLIIQGHMDMVCEKLSGSGHDFSCDPIQLTKKIVEGREVLTAGETTLGADNGIALAMGLALLHEPALKCGPLTLLFTSDEEVGLNGATGLDGSLLSGRFLINLDSEEEGELCIGCAGGETLLFSSIETVTTEAAGSDCVYATLELDGFAGGHSGIDIDNNRLNAICEMLSILSLIAETAEMRLCSFYADGRHNVISNRAEAEISIRVKGPEDVKALLQNRVDQELERIRAVEPGADLRLSVSEASGKNESLTPSGTRNWLDRVSLIPYGPISRTQEMGGMVQTSANPSALKLDGGKSEGVVSLRSSESMELNRLSEDLTEILQQGGGSVVSEGRYPGWAPVAQDPFVLTVAEAWREFTGEEMRITAVHAGLECGVLGEKLPGCSMVSLGPDMDGVHSPEEYLVIESAEKVYEFIKKLIQSGRLNQLS